MGPLSKRAHCFYPYQTTSLLGQGIRTSLSNNLNNIEQHKQLLFYGLPRSLFLSANYTNLSVRTRLSNNFSFWHPRSWDHAKSPSR